MRACKDCGALYEPTGKGGRCLSCRRTWEREWRVRRKATGNPVKSTKMPRSYHQAYEAVYLANPENRKRIAEAMRRYTRDPKLRPRHEARWIARRAIVAGRLVRQPCEVCGDAKSQAHHDDYAKPLDIRWLCRKHHNEFHAKAEGRS